MKFIKFDEISLLQTHLAFILLFIIDPDLQNTFQFNFSLPLTLFNLFLIIIFIIGSFLAIGNAFVDRDKPLYNKRIVLLSFIIINIFSSIMSLRYIIKNGNDLDTIFPGINLIMALTVLFFWRLKAFSAKDISDVDAKIHEVIISIIIIVLMLFFLTKSKNYYWAITFTICMSYATMLNKSILDLIKNIQKFILKKT